LSLMYNNPSLWVVCWICDIPWWEYEEIDSQSETMQRIQNIFQKEWRSRFENFVPLVTLSVVVTKFGGDIIFWQNDWLGLCALFSE
jgi:hypothetical protein